MPSPILSYTRIREYAERWSWTDPATNIQITGYDPPKNAIDPQHVPFLITFLTEDGIPYRARVICVGVNTATHSRRLRFLTEGRIHLLNVSSTSSRINHTNAAPIPDSKVIPVGETRQVSDILIVEIDGVRFAANT